MRRLGIAVIGQGVTTVRLLHSSATCDRMAPTSTSSTRKSARSFCSPPQPSAPKPIPFLTATGTSTEVRPAAHSPDLTCVSYQGLDPLRAALLKTMQAISNRPGMGPEELRTRLAHLTPADLGVAGIGDPVLDRFQLKLFTEGSGTQIFSTTFAQWTAREVLRRAQPYTLVVRFAPRQRQQPMNELLSNAQCRS